MAADPVWYRAATLAERLALPRSPAVAAADAEAESRARFRLQAWTTQTPFATGSYFDQRLAQVGLDRARFWELLLEPETAVAARFASPPRWLLDIDAALSLPGESTYPELLPERLAARPSAGFLLGAAPLIELALSRLDRRLVELRGRSASPCFDPATIKKILFAPLPAALFELLGRALVLELNIARVEGELAGDQPEQRFQSFLQALRRRERAGRFLREYPVLARLLAEHVERWVAVSLEFLERLCADFAAIRARLSPDQGPGALVALSGNLADTHAGGRSVLIARFESGLKVVYKPRSLGVDVHFQELLGWLNARGASPPFRTLAVIDRGDYGWVEHVAARECGSLDEVRRFYQRQGGFLALFYALEATDFHRDNLVACGEHPVPIDVEALFHPRHERARPAAADEPVSAHRLARRALSGSVLHVGLLPERGWSSSEGEGVDLSGLATIEKQITPHAQPDWEGAGTDAMRFVRKRKEIHPADNVPRLLGAPVEVLDHQQAILDGFAATYALLQERRGELLAEDGPLARFAGDEVCVFLRSSRSYRRLLRESFHPDVLRDALDRDRLFDLLWAAVERDPELAQIVPAEQAELLRGDVPRFTARPGSRDLTSGAGRVFPGFFAESSLAASRRRIEGLGAEDRERQAWLVQAALATLPGSEARWPSRPLLPAAAPASPSRLDAAAAAAGDQLEASAIRGDGDATWIGLHLERDRLWTVERLGCDLYGGLPGVALFLAQLGAITGQTRYTRLARAALGTLRRRIEATRSSITRIGAFDGWGGLLYSLTHLGALWDEPALVAEATAMVEQLPDLVAADETLDVVGGAAGCIGGLRCLDRLAPATGVTEVAVQCGERLLARAEKTPHGIGWVTKQAGPQPLAGFAHGTAGIVWSLLVLHEWTGAERFRSAAREAIAHERSLFVPEAGNWRDLRAPGACSGGCGRAQPGFMNAWCHGAAGIGLARLDRLASHDDDDTRAEVASALRTTARFGFGNNHSLCHGDLGNLELLAEASRVLADAEARDDSRRLAASLLDSIERHGVWCGAPFGLETPGLMTGLAGVGYGLLRLAHPERVPSVLSFEPPRRPSRPGAENEPRVGRR